MRLGPARKSVNFQTAAQQTFTCSKSAKETIGKGVKYVQS